MGLKPLEKLKLCEMTFQLLSPVDLSNITIQTEKSPLKKEVNCILRKPFSLDELATKCEQIISN